VVRNRGQLNLANQLTLLRLALVPAFAILTLNGQLGWALIVFVVAGLTDALDGLVARMTNQRTAVGAWLDPMADKLLLLTTFVILSLPGIGLTNVLPWSLTVLVISRDVAIVLTAAVITLALGPRTFSPTVYGKAATATYVVTSIVVMWFNYLRQTSVLVDVGLGASLVLTLVSGVHYLVHVRRIINGPPTPPSPVA
jgi:cardiolipin synthase